MIAEDLYENLLRQKVNMMDVVKNSNRLVFIDTDAMTTLFYAGFLLADTKEYDNCYNLAHAINNITDYDLVLFLEPTVAFVQDGTRNETIAADREKYSQIIKSLLDLNNIKYTCIGGDYLGRFIAAKELIKDELGIDTKW